MDLLKPASDPLLRALYEDVDRLVALCQHNASSAPKHTWYMLIDQALVYLRHATNETVPEACLHALSEAHRSVVSYQIDEAAANIRLALSYVDEAAREIHSEHTAS